MTGAGTTDPSTVVKGHRWCATMQLRTPLASLEMHARVVPLSETLPAPEAEWMGIWLPELKSWAELGIKGLKESGPSTMASDIGPIPKNGGRYLPFLLAFRRIVESSSTPFEKLTAIDTLARHPEHRWVLQHHQLSTLRAFLSPTKTRG